ncbi:hypothetical protein B0O80DRAFT_179324 [Mortierella sp. GBAus27b]|nr:hypothetical protein B0O80DRAFT_179324 [Mortierella sp. GBAus27b]
MNDFLDRHPSCVHSDLNHNIMSMYSHHSAGTSCSCEECARYKLPLEPVSEQSSAIDEMLQQQHVNMSMGTTSTRAPGLGRIDTSSPPTTYLARRPSTTNSATSPKMQPAGFGLSGGVPKMQPHERRASFEFHNRERSFQQHSATCDCRGSGVGCGCSYTCSC